MSPDAPVPMPSTPATDSWQRTPTLRARVAMPGSPSWDHRRNQWRAWGTRSRRAGRCSQAGVPVIPGTIDRVTDPAEAARIAAEVGYPVMIKASAGGGGKGIRLVRSEPELVRAMRNAQEEAQAAFSNGAVFVEKMISPARHIEVQLIADQHGNVVTLGERECSLQRRRQKLIEEAPSPVMTPKLRARMEEAAKTVARACDYVNVATVEFLVYDRDQFAFLEMNTRLQVEHPVTELVRGVDLVRDQLRVAAGQPLGYTGKDHPIRGWAMECRIIAEDPFNDFLPSLGPIPYYLEPSGPGVRVDGMLHAGMEVSMHYDSLLAKLIVWGRKPATMPATDATRVGRVRRPRCRDQHPLPSGAARRSALYRRRFQHGIR